VDAECRHVMRPSFQFAAPSVKRVRSFLLFVTTIVTLIVVEVLTSGDLDL